MRKRINIIKNLLFIGIGIFLFWLVYRDIKFDELKKALAEANYSWVFLGLTVALIGHFLRALRWRLLVKALGYSISSGRAFMAVMINYLANIAIPRAGEISRPLVISKTDNAPFSKLVGTIIVERIFDLIMLLSISTIAILIEYEKLKDLIYEILDLNESRFGKYLNTTNIVIFIALILIVFIALLLIKKSNRAFKQHHIYQRIRKVISSFWAGIKTIWTMKNKFLFILYTIGIWVTYFFMTYLVFFAIPATSNLGLIEGLLVLAIGSLGFILPSPGGVGTYHYAVILALSIYQIIELDARVYATLAWTSQTLTLLIVGTTSYLVFMLIMRKNNSNASIIKGQNILSREYEESDSDLEK